MRTTLPNYIDFTSWVANWCTQAPKFGLSDGRQVYSRVKQVGVDANDAVDRGGITFLQNAMSNPMKQGRWLESKQLMGGTNGQDYPGESLPPQVWVDWANSLPLYGFEEDEFQEGEWRVRSESAQYIAFKQARAQKYAAAGVPNNTYYCYGGFFIPAMIEWKVQGVPQDPTSNYFRQYYASQGAARQWAQGYFSLLFGKTWPNIKYYPETPYTSQDYYIVKAKMEWLMLGVGPGGKCALVFSDLIESLPGTTDPQNATHANAGPGRRVQSPPGKAISGAHPQWDYDQMLATALVCGLVVGTIVVAWDNMSLRSSDPNTVYNAPDGDVEHIIWQPDNAGTPPPYPSNGDPGYPPQRLTWYDYAIAGAAWLYKQWESTAGAPWNYLRYRVNGGEWVETLIDKSDILFHAKFKRGDCMGRVAGNNASFFYYNPSIRKDQYETVTVQVGGKEFTNVCQGGKIHTFQETL